jgi:predicted NUDIX family NTP pyrophosphohydrolase
MERYPARTGVHEDIRTYGDAHRAAEVGRMAQVSAGILLYRRGDCGLEVFLVHPGGPFWERKDEGAWSVPKGLVDAGEGELECARREFTEETGFDLRRDGAELDLGSFRLPSGKRLRVWAVEGNCDAAALRSNCFEMEWPSGSGRRGRFPEVDRGEWFARAPALRKISAGQRQLLESFYSRMTPPA